MSSVSSALTPKEIEVLNALAMGSIESYEENKATGDAKLKTNKESSVEWEKYGSSALSLILNAKNRRGNDYSKENVVKLLEKALFHGDSDTKYKAKMICFSVLNEYEDDVPGELYGGEKRNPTGLPRNVAQYFFEQKRGLLAPNKGRGALADLQDLWSRYSFSTTQYALLFKSPSNAHGPDSPSASQ